LTIRLHTIALVAAFVISPSVAQAPAPTPTLPPVDAFGTLPTISDPAISPDGKYLALIQVLKGRPVATIRTLDALSSAPVVIPYEEGFIDEVRWANDHRLLVRVNLNARVLGDNVNPWHRTIAIDPDAKNPAVLFSNMQKARDDNYFASKIVDLAPDDPDHIYMPLYSGGGVIAGVYDEPRLTLYRVDVNTGHAQYVEHGGAHTVEWYMDGNGKIAARLDQTKSPLTHHLMAYTPDKDWREIASADAQNASGLSVYGVSLDGKSLVMSAIQEQSGIGGLILMSLADGKESELYFNPIYDISDTLMDPWTGRVVGAAVTMHLDRDFYFDPTLQEMQTDLENANPGLAIHALTWDRAIDKVIISVDGPMAPPTIYLFDRRTKQLTRLGRTYSHLQPSDLGEVHVYNYKARDGLEIPAYLTLPPGKTAKNLPVVIMPHGGPMARDSMRFDWESQFLANRGYAVLRPNFRGSSGYGTKFMEAGFGQWGLKMQDDITDGVKKLIADGIADPKRICIAGSSYGGYAALAGAAFTPDLYACAAAWAPVADLRQFLSTRSEDFGSDSYMISSWQHFIGDRWDDSEKLDAASPSENAAKIKAPILLMHGEADATVRIDQSERMDRALRRAGKKVTFIRIAKETHYMQTSDTRIRWLTELEKFLKENIGN
jgi:dipeptidyl aminopeptidase/acylaminoacyl peptidase